MPRLPWTSSESVFRVTPRAEAASVIVRPMGGYQLPEWVRISVGTTAENKRTIQALKTVLGQAQPLV